MDNKNTVLILAPHTDDGELGCGGAIARLCAAGKKVYYVAFSSCSKSLPEHLPQDTLEHELKAATLKLGIPAEHVIIYDYDVRLFHDHRQHILEDMIALRSRLNPDLVFTPSPTDIHQDHQVITAEAIRAFKNTSILGYEMPWNNLSFNTRSFVKLTAAHIDTKVNSLKEYTSQLDRPYFQEEFIRSLARTRGVQIGADYAEVFEVVRWVI